jgi:lipoprotein-anchoring transpeptidase ErfK/SrfK
MRATILRASPGGKPLANVNAHTEFGGPDYMWAVAHRSGWLAVISPLVGNGHTGWISESATKLERNPWELKVSLSARRLTVLRRNKVVQRSTVAIGPPQTPTPVGRFAVTDRLITTDPNGPYGCCILALSAHAPHTIQGWGGGDRIAIHSTPDAASIGEAVSHGCVRVTMAEGRWLLNHIPLATPTVISN